MNFVNNVRNITLTMLSNTYLGMNVNSVSQARRLASSTVKVRDHLIHYEKVGTGDHALLLMPGAIGSARTDFGPQLEHLNKEKLTLVAWDPPGYGKSRPPERKWPPHFLARDAEYSAELMKILGVEKYSILGWSDGGISSLIHAARYPDNVNKLIVLGANSYVTKEEVQFYSTIQNIESWSERMRKPFEDLYGRERFDKLWSGWVDAFISYYYVEKKGSICDDELENITCPTLIINGRKDAMVPGFHADHLHKHIAGSRLHQFDDGKHNLHFKYFKEFNSLVEQFLNE